jgi:hypothetical protein
MSMYKQIVKLTEEGLKPKEIAKRTKAKINYIYFVRNEVKKAGKKKPRKQRKVKITRKDFLTELQPGLDALFGLEHKKTVNFAQKKDGTIVDLDEGGKVIFSPDPVNHPAHYKAGGIETIDFIEAKDLNYRLGNVVKYVARAGKKDTDPIQDLEKAAWYLQREIAARKQA